MPAGLALVPWVWLHRGRQLLAATLLLGLAALPAQGPASQGSASQGPASLGPATAVSAVDAAHDDEAGEECSVGVAHGKATVDGRPLLWKNRDAQKRDNVVTAFDDGRFPYVAICDAGSKTAVWGGANAAGFCIMNSVSRDLPQGSKQGPGNGGFMKLALMRCATVDEFAALLEETNSSGRTTRANFGVIDAHGGAAFFETSHREYHRFDAKAAENGILVRTNFATTADGKGGRERFARASALCQAIPRGKLDHTFLLQQFCRDLQAPKSAEDGGDDRQDVRETLHRQTTVAAMVFHGCKPGEDPGTTTMWAVVGQPLFAPAVPCFPAVGKVSVLLAGDPKSRLCNLALELQGAFYDLPPPVAPDAEPLEADVAGAIRWLRRTGLDEVRRAVLAAEQAQFAAAGDELERWRGREKLTEEAKAALYLLHERSARAAEALLGKLVADATATAR
jgi:hypothetical protein